jgi:hypothetical protein
MTPFRSQPLTHSCLAFFLNIGGMDEKEWISGIDSVIIAFPPKVLSKIIFEYLLEARYMFDLNRVYVGDLGPVVKLNDKDKFIHLSDQKIEYKQYSNPWIYVLSRYTIGKMESSWSFVIDGEIWDRLYIGVCSVHPNGACEKTSVVSFYQPQACSYTVTKTSLPNFLKCNKANVSGTEKRNEDFHLCYSENSYFFVTTGFRHQTVRILP